MAVARGGNEQISMRAAGSEPGRRRASKAEPANQVHAVRLFGAWSPRQNCIFVIFRTKEKFMLNLCFDAILQVKPLGNAPRWIQF